MTLHMRSRFFPLASLGLCLSAVFQSAFAHEAVHATKKHGPAQHVPAKQQGVVSLDIYRDGALLHLLTLEINVKQVRRLLYRQSSDDGRTWTDPVDIDQASRSIYDLTRGGDAQIAASGRRVVVLWTAKGSGYAGSGPLMSAVSIDSGRTWRAGGNPADDRSNAGHGYAELAASNGTFDAVWLDDRDGAQGLRHARSHDGVTWEKNTTVQSKTCECCWQSLAQSSDGLLAMFRGRDPRDMQLSVLRSGAAAWTPRGPVGKFDWDFNGCPHTGGALVSTRSGQSLHAVVWTGAAGKQGLHHMSSSHGGGNWRVSSRLGSQDAQRSDLALSADGKTLAVVWDQLAGTRRLIYGAHSVDGGTTWLTPRRLSADSVDALCPRIVTAGNGFLAAWTESTNGEAGKLKMAAYTTTAATAAKARYTQ